MTVGPLLEEILATPLFQTDIHQSYGGFDVHIRFKTV